MSEVTQRISTKKITMSVDEYNSDMRAAESAGVEKLMALVSDIIDNAGANIQIEDGADQKVVEFLDKVKAVVGSDTKPA